MFMHDKQFIWNAHIQSLCVMCKFVNVTRKYLGKTSPCCNVPKSVINYTMLTLTKCDNLLTRLKIRRIYFCDLTNNSISKSLKRCFLHEKKKRNESNWDRIIKIMRWLRSISLWTESWNHGIRVYSKPLMKSVKDIAEWWVVMLFPIR